MKTMNMEEKFHKKISDFKKKNPGAPLQFMVKASNGGSVISNIEFNGESVSFIIKNFSNKVQKCTAPVSNLEKIYFADNGLHPVIKLKFNTTLLIN